MKQITKIRICLVALGLSMYAISFYLVLIYTTVIYDANNAHPINWHPYTLEGYIIGIAAMIFTLYGIGYKPRNKKESNNSILINEKIIKSL